MTLEEIHRKLKQNNPYYEQSQAFKEEQAGMKYDGDSIIHTPESINLKKEYNNEVSNDNNYVSTPINRNYINVPISNNRINLNRARLTDYMNIKDKDSAKYIKSYTGYKKLKDSPKDIWNNYKFLHEKAASGVLNGVTGIAQGQLTDTSNNLQKGANMNKGEIARTALNIVSPVLGEAVSTVEDIKDIANGKNKIINILKDNNKNGLQKGVDIGLDVISNAKDKLDINHVSDYTKLSGKLLPGADKEVLKANQVVSAPSEKYKEYIKDKYSNNSKATEFVGNAFESVGNMVPSITASMITKDPNISLAMMGASVKGQATQEALNNGLSLEKATQIGDAKALVEVATEKLSGGAKIFGKGSVDDLADDLIKKGAKSKVGRFVMKQLFNSAGEIAEEEVANVADNLIDKATVDPNRKIIDLKEGLETAGSTAFTTTLLNLLTGGMINDYYDAKNSVIEDNQNNTLSKEELHVINKATQLESNSNQSNLNKKLINSISNENSNIQIAPLDEKSQIKYDSQNFAKQIDEVEKGIFPKNNTLVLLNKTPKVLQDIGLKDLPITLTQKHLDTIANEKGKYKNANYHNLGIDVVKQLPEAIANPLNIYQSSTKDDSIVLVTHLSDKKGNIVLASIKVDGKGTINGIVVDSNHMTSAYGKDNYDYNIDKKTGEYKPGWAELNKDNMLYDIDDGIIQKNISSMARFQSPRYTTNVPINNIIPQNENYASSTKKVLNPTEISNLTQNDISTTPKLPKVKYKTNENFKSDFYNNLMSKTGMLDKNLRNLIRNDSDIKYYEGVTNKLSLQEAYEKLENDRANETLRWFSKDLNNKSAKVSATDVAEGWILLKQYQDAGDYESAVTVAKKMRDMATKSGQALQAYSIQARLTPEGMFQYAQSELQDAFEKFSKNKTQEWIDKHKQDFDLKPEETQAIIDKVKEAQELPDNSYDKKEKLAEINKIMTDKLPPERGAGIKSWMRISMLFNPKTQVRNILGNAVVAPVNAVGDVISSIADRVVSKKTGVRTTGISNPISNIKGFKKGLYESYNDFKKGINTRNIEGNRFEIGEGKAFKDKGLGKALNRLDAILNFALDAGDRPFYEATFTNSINNQLLLNNTDVVNQDMIDIATREALSRTWQDNNNYTKFVLSTRNALNKLNIKGYGLGDVLIPFAKTPANLTKAIIDYSPVGLVNSLIEGNEVRKAIGRNDLTAQQQHKFVQDLGKATAGTMLYVLGYALAKAGITSGKSDEDKDVANFMKNTLGTSKYSIKIGNKSYTYDWAQPVATPFTIMADIVNKSNKEENLLERITSVLNVPLNNILEQSFMQSINTVLTNNNGPADGLAEAISELPSRAIPTFMKQIVDLTDKTQRSTYEKGKPIQTAVNKVKAKIPGLSKQLAPVSSTLGNDVKKYGGETNPFLYAFNTLINPANVNVETGGKVGTEIYKVYQKTGDKTIFPRQASYSQTIDGNKINLTSNEKYDYQKTMGEYVNNVVGELLKSNTYNKLSDYEKAKILKEIVSDSNEIAKQKLAKSKNLKYERSKTDVIIDELVNNGLEYGNAYIYKTQISKINGDKDSTGKTIENSGNVNKVKYIYNMDTTGEQKDKLLSLISDTDTKILMSDLNKLNGNYNIYIQQSGKKNDKGISDRDKYMMYIDAGIPVNTLNKYYNEIGSVEGIKNASGKTISGSKKQAVINYINSLSLNATQKKILLTKYNSSYGKNYQNEIFDYINNLNINKKRKEQIWNELFN